MTIVAFTMLTTLMSGCSMIIDESGIDPCVPRTRELVYERFGRPDQISTVRLTHRRSGEVRDFEIEQYKIHAKIAPHEGLPVIVMFETGIFAEPILTPLAIIKATKEIVAGHELEFIYNDLNEVIGFRYPASSEGKTFTRRAFTYTDDWREPDKVNGGPGFKWSGENSYKTQGHCPSDYDDYPQHDDP